MVTVTLALCSAAPAAHAHHDVTIRTIILASRQLGAHGLGYGKNSLARMSRMLSSKDIPGLLRIYASGDMEVGVQFALASLCRAGLDGTLQAVKKGTFRASGRYVDFYGAESIAHLVSIFDRCDTQTQQRAGTSIAEIRQMKDVAYARHMKETEKRRAEDARVQANGIRLLSEGASTSLTKAEREEVFARSVKAAGLDGPRTPEQEQLVKRMYDGMVLNRPSTSSNAHRKQAPAIPLQ